MTDIRQQLLEARQDVERARQRLQQERSRLSSRATISQTSGRAGVLQRQMATGTIAQQEQVVQQREQELKQVEQQLPGPEEYSDADALKIARKLYKAKVGVKNTRGKIRQYYKELRDNEDAAVESAVNDIERQLNMSIEPKLKAKIEEDVRKAVTGDIRLAELNDRLNIKLGNQTLDPSQLKSLNISEAIKANVLPTKFPPRTELVSGLSSRQSNMGVSSTVDYSSYSQISPAQKEGQSWLERYRQRVQETRFTGSPLARLGAGVQTSAIVEPIAFISSFVQSPKKTASSIVGATKEKANIFFKTSGTVFPNIGNVLRTEPQYATGYVGGLFALDRVPTVVVPKVVDTVRTFGKIEVPTEAVVAPEYFRGQSYPRIRKGQTAGELEREFQPSSQYGVTNLVGFSAAPKPIKGTIVLPSKSEIPGLYIAPKLSPMFLKIGGSAERSLIGVSPFPTLRPTSLLVRPTRVSLIGGVKRTQKRLAGKESAIKFFKEEAKPGEAYIPFIKTEKEAVVTPGTRLIGEASRLFFTFEGRKIPIYEFGTASGQKLEGTISIGEVSSYYKPPRSAPIISPYDILKVKGKDEIATYSSSSTPNKAKVSYFATASSSRGVVLSSVKPSYSIGPSSAVSYISPSSQSDIPPPPRPSYRAPPPPRPPTYRRERLSRILSRISEGKAQRSAYNVFVRRKGKEIKIASSLPYGRAIMTGIQRNLGDLSASFRLEEKGTTSLSDIAPRIPKTFGPSKAERGRIVQARGTRLSARSELVEIKRARRNKWF